MEGNRDEKEEGKAPARSLANRLHVCVVSRVRNGVRTYARDQDVCARARLHKSEKFVDFD
jgi:hypothetical protein